MAMLRMSKLRRTLSLLGAVSFIAIVTLSLLMWLGPVERSLPFFLRPRPSVTLQQGIYIGVDYRKGPQTIEQFLGIPYALSTFGERRFKPPVPVPASKESYDASDYGKVCPAGAGGTFRRDEDCLNLNVFRPKKMPKDKKLPILIDFHGGAFNFGAGKDRPMANMVSWSAEPFIGVNFNYRLGAFGFLPSKLTEKEGLLNLGLKDQVLMLQWVQANIAEFGGDPNDVTLMGQSAGGHSIGHHILGNNAEKPLLHKAILESGAATARVVYTPTNPMHEQQFQEFLTILGCEKLPEGEIMQKLRTYSTQEIKEASEMIFEKYNPSARWPWQPVIDGQGGIIPIRPIDSLEAGNWMKIPILTGFNTNEGANFVPKMMAASAEFTDFFHTLLPGLSADDLKQLDTLYPDPLTDPSSKYVDTRVGLLLGPEYKRAEQTYAHFAYVAPVKHTAHFAATASDKPVYLYHFAVNSSIEGGCGHGSNSWFPMYHNDVTKASKTIKEISGSMHAYWTSFVTTGDPNAVKLGKFKDRPQWPVYAASKAKLIVFGEGNDEIAKGSNKGTAVKIEDDTWAAEECKYWWDRTAKFEL